MKLLTRLPISSSPRNPRAVTPPERFRAPDVGPVLGRLGGAALGEGAYRVHAANEIEHWTKAAVQAVPELEGGIWCFASDWMGRQFALTAEPPGGRHGVSLLEPSSGT